MSKKIVGQRKSRIREKTDAAAPTDQFALYAKLISPTSVYVKREHHYDKPSTRIDTYGNFWSIAVSDQSENPMGMRALGKDVYPVGRSAAYCPPFSIVEWVIPQGVVKPAVLMSSLPLPPGMPEKPVFFSLVGTELENADPVQPNAEQLIIDIVLRQTQFQSGEKLETANVVASRLKKKIDAEFSLQKEINSYAKELGISHEVMSRYFKGCYGMSPQEYRNGVRTFQAMFTLMLNQANVVRTKEMVGFEDQSHFNEQFKKNRGTSPQDFKLVEEPKKPKKS